MNGQLAKNAIELLTKMGEQVTALGLTDDDDPQMRSFVGMVTTCTVMGGLLVEAIEQVADAIANKPSPIS